MTAKPRTLPLAGSVRVAICPYLWCTSLTYSFRFHGDGAGAGRIRRIPDRSVPFAPCAARDAGHGLWFSHPANSSRRLHGHGDTYRLPAPGAAGRDRRKFRRRSSFLTVAAHIVIRFRRCGRAHLCQRFSFNVHQQFLLSCVVDLALGALRRLIRFFKLDAPFEV